MPDHLFQRYPREIAGGRLFCFGAVTWVPEEGEDTSTPTVRINANPIPGAEEY